MAESKAYRIIFAGSPDFALPALDALYNSRHEIIAVITQEDKPTGRKQELRSTAVKLYAQAKGLKLYEPKNLRDSEAMEKLLAEDCDFLITAAYGKLMPPSLLELPRIKAINIHASLLPKYRGAAPIQAAILNGDKEAGVSIMEMLEELDAGPVYWQESLTLTADETGASLFSKLAELGAKAILNCLDAWPQLEPKEQDESQVSYCSKLDRAAGRLDWSKPALELERMIRAFYPWPSTHTFLDGQRFIIWRAKLIAQTDDEVKEFLPPELLTSALDSAGKLKPGKIIPHEKQMIVLCGEGALSLTELQRAGQKRTAAAEMVHNLRAGQAFD